MLRENRINEDGTMTVFDKVENSIKWLKSFEPSDGYYLAFSGGKDSCVLKELANMAGVKYDAHYNVTSVDPPELLRFIKKHHPDVVWDFPREDPNDPASPVKTMWNLIPKHKMPPTRLVRYCCAELKESQSDGRVALTGVRWAESVRRKNDRNLVDIGEKKSGVIFNNDNDEARREVESYYRHRRVTVNPIINWTDDDVWEFIRERNLPYCELYDKGYKRLGCIGCPMSSSEAEFEAYPKYKEAYLRAFRRMIENREKAGLSVKNKCDWSTPEKVMEWWIGKSADYDKNQITIMELGLDDDYFEEVSE